jgi:hypothetical protein
VAFETGVRSGNGQVVLTYMVTAAGAVSGQPTFTG